MQTLKPLQGKGWSPAQIDAAKAFDLAVTDRESDIAAVTAAFAAVEGGARTKVRNAIRDMFPAIIEEAMNADDGSAIGLAPRWTIVYAASKADAATTTPTLSDGDRDRIAVAALTAALAAIDVEPDAEPDDADAVNAAIGSDAFATRVAALQADALRGLKGSPRAGAGWADGVAIRDALGEQGEPMTVKAIMASVNRGKDAADRVKGGGLKRHHWTTLARSPKAKAHGVQRIHGDWTEAKASAHWATLTDKAREAVVNGAIDAGGNRATFVDGKAAFDRP